MENIPEPFQSPKSCSSRKAARALENQQQSRESLAAVVGVNGGGVWPVSKMGFWARCWTLHIGLCQRVVGALVPMVFVPLRKMVPPVEQS